MTGRELIIYILQNGLEDEPVFKDGKFIGFITPSEAAVKMNVGFATVFAFINEGLIPGERVNGGTYIPGNFKSPTEGVESNG